MKTARTDLAALVLVALVITAITLLTLQHQAPPEILSTVALVALGIGGGVALPRGTTTELSGSTAAAEPAPASPAVAGEAFVREIADVPPVATHAPA